MNTLSKFEKIIDWQFDASIEDVSPLLPQPDIDRIRQVENISEETFPSELMEIFQRYDGEAKTGLGAFLGHSLVNLNWMTDQLLEARNSIKNDNPTVPDKTEASRVFDLIAQHLIGAIPDKSSFWRRKYKWHKILFECSPNSTGGPYLYTSPDTLKAEHIILKLSQDTLGIIYKLVKRLHGQEQEDFGWDKLNICVYSNGARTIDRTFFDFDNSLPLTSFPSDSIQLVYQNHKWIPVIHDGGNNYIGIDLDPGENGSKGQVIVYGRDDLDRFVVADNWDSFLDYILRKIEVGGEQFKEQIHLHDIVKNDVVEN